MDDRRETPSNTVTMPGRAGGASPPSLHKLINLSRPHHLLELLGKAVGAAHGAIGLVSAEGDLQEHMTFGIDEGLAQELRGSPWGGELIRCILHQTAPIKVADFGRDLPACGLPLSVIGQPPLATGPFLGVPLICHGRCRGALYLARAPGQPPFSDQDLETILPVCTWLEHGNLFEEARLLAQLRLLNQLAQAAAGSLDLPRILTIALRELDRHLPQYSCAVWLLEDAVCAAAAEGQRNSAEAASKSPPFLALHAYGMVANERATKLGLTPGLRLPLDETRFAACLRDGKAQYLDLTRSDGEKPGAADSALSPFESQLCQRGASSSFAVPLRAGDQAVGVLHSLCTRASGFTNDQIQLLYLVADLLGPAISNCQLFRRLRAAYEELRTAQNQLIQAEKMRALGELAGGMAHDFNNSLCGVLGFLELALSDKGLDPTIFGYLESARTCTLDAAHTVRRVQNFARWQRNEQSSQLLDFNELVRQTLELTRHKWESLAHARGTPITVQLEAEATEWLLGSAAELREVLTNLVFNAVDAMPQGGQLALHTWSTVTHLYFSVNDTGVGMSDSTRRRLFEPFFTTKGERGTGLGLSVTFGIIQRYGGEITVESEPGRGSTFTVCLPLKGAGRERPSEKEESPVSFSMRKMAEFPSPNTPWNLRNKLLSHPARGNPAAQEEAAVAMLVEKRDTASPPLSNRSGLRILVVEDEESIRRFLTKALTQLGHSPRTVADAQEGLTAFSEERFDLLITDLGLPGMSGEELARTIARKSPATPVILLTGWSSQLKDEAQSLTGVTNILGKPITISTLSSTIAAVCQR
jgi:signal transduction histidine kinase/CheY-like chemotaxis protein